MGVRPPGVAPNKGKYAYILAFRAPNQPDQPQSVQMCVLWGREGIHEAEAVDPSAVALLSEFGLDQDSIVLGSRFQILPVDAAVRFPTNHIPMRVIDLPKFKKGCASAQLYAGIRKDGHGLHVRHTTIVSPDILTT